MYPSQSNLKTGFFRNQAIFIALLPILFFISATPSFADGMVVEIDPYDDRFTYADEDNQSAFINYENGMEKMILSIGIDDQSDSRLVWIFPVPSDPDRIVLDILKSLPELAGMDLSEKAKSTLWDIRFLINATQIYTIPFMTQPYYPRSGHFRSQAVFTNSSSDDVEPDVIVHEHIEKEGITSEIITARTADGLYNYLSRMGLDIDTGAIPVLDYYIGSEFSFVVSWITKINRAYSTEGSHEDFSGNHVQKGVFVTFPTDEIYYPLLPTSVYGSVTVPAVIRVIGHVTPHIFDGINNFTTTEYYIDGYIRSTEGLGSFYNGPVNNIKYTRIEIDAPSKFLTEDLWISRRAPVKTNFSMFVVNNSFLTGLIFFLLSSVAAGIIAGWIVFRNLRVKILTLALLGLSNCFSIIGVIVATFCAMTETIPEDAKELLGEMKKRGYLRKRKLASFLFVYAIPFLLLGFFILPYFSSEYSFIEILIFYVLPIIAFMFALDNMRVEKEDRGLFRELREKHKSKFFIHPVEGGKIIFIPLFSVFFLLISWLLVKLVENLV